MKKISVIVPSYNSASTIPRTLESLLNGAHENIAEIIVVDSSDDGKTPALLARYAGAVRLIRLKKKTPPAVARNLGARQASAEILAFIDSDAYAAEGWTKGIVQAVEAGSRVGGGAVLVPDFQKYDALSLAQHFLQFSEFTDGSPEGTKKFVPSCNLFCEKTLFFETGGFPEIRASEDVLFGLAAGRIAPVMFHPEIKVCHIFRNRWQSYFQNQKMLGKYILIYRRSEYGGFFYTAGAVVPLLPFLFPAKFLKVASRVARGKPGRWLLFLYSSPALLAGILCWMSGYVQASFEKNPATRQKPDGGTVTFS